METGTITAFPALKGRSLRTGSGQREGPEDSKAQNESNPEAEPAYQVVREAIHLPQRGDDLFYGRGGADVLGTARQEAALDESHV